MALDLQRALVTLADVKGWQDEKAELEGRISAIQTEFEGRISVIQDSLADINKKLDAAAILSPEVASLKIVTSPPQVRVSGGGNGALVEQETLIDAVVRLVAHSSSPMTAKQLRKALLNEGYENNQVGNYLYTVFGRLLKRGRIARYRNRYSLPLDRVTELQSHGTPSNG